jgi:hypothetical protein
MHPSRHLGVRDAPLEIRIHIRICIRIKKSAWRFPSEDPRGSSAECRQRLPPPLPAELPARERQAKRAQRRLELELEASLQNKTTGPRKRRRGGPVGYDLCLRLDEYSGHACFLFLFLTVAGIGIGCSRAHALMVDLAGNLYISPLFRGFDTGLYLIIEQSRVLIDRSEGLEEACSSVWLGDKP